MRGCVRSVAARLTTFIAILTLAACGTPVASSPAASPSSASPGAIASASQATLPPTTVPAQVATPSRTAKESPVLSDVPFQLRSASFAEGAPIPRKYTCDGANVSPALEWSGAPSATAAFALIVEDPDANGFVHWVAFNLTASATGALAEGISESPDAPPQGRNGFGRIGYGGPCPPSGTHRYVFQLYALASPLELTGTPSAAEVRRAAEGKVLGQAKLTATYRRGG